MVYAFHMKTELLKMRRSDVQVYPYGREVKLMMLRSKDEVPKDESRYMWCFHGTSFSTAHKVLFIDALRAGPSTDGGRTGVFFVGPEYRDDPMGDLGLLFQLARDRAKCYLCTEWRRYGSPSVWSMPVVLMFQYNMWDTTRLHPYKMGGAAKYVIQRDPGTALNEVTRFRLLLNLDDYQNWLRVHDHVRQGPSNRPLELKDLQGFDIVMCGGRINDPIYWSRVDNNCSASCGRFCRVQDLERYDWRHANHKRIDERIYRCPLCHF